METQKHTITYMNTNKKITQFFSESNEQFNNRLEVLKLLEKDNIKYNDAIKISKLYYNVKYMKCKYIPFVYNMVRKYL